MPDGNVAICYAENIAHGMAQAAYDKGFDNHYWKPQHLNSPKSVSEGAGIFVGSMSDVFAHNVPTEHIQAVLDVIADTPFARKPLCCLKTCGWALLCHLISCGVSR
jgi:protein gp37